MPTQQDSLSFTSSGHSSSHPLFHSLERYAEKSFLKEMGKGCLWLYLAVIAFWAVPVLHATDYLDVMALQDLYTALNTPPQLVGWKRSNGNPCEESWRGILCSGSSVIYIKEQCRKVKRIEEVRAKLQLRQGAIKRQEGESICILSMSKSKNKN